MTVAALPGAGCHLASAALDMPHEGAISHNSAVRFRTELFGRRVRDKGHRPVLIGPQIKRSLGELRGDI